MSREVGARYRFYVHARHPAYRLVLRDDAVFPEPGREADWTLSRTREEEDVNVQVRDDIARDGYSLFRIGLSWADLPD